MTADNMPALKEELRHIPDAMVRDIYLQDYWRPAACPGLPPPLALFHFDTAVNQGVAGAAQMLQQAVGVDIDGEIGPITLAAAAGQPLPLTLAVYAEIRRQRYRALGTFWRFGKGWLQRVDRTLELAITLIGATPASPPPQPKEQPPMGLPTPSPDTSVIPAPDSKWWAHSLTIWGVIVTTLSAVLPTIGPALGLNITAELIQQLGQNVVLFGQAAGALLGTVMTVYGRIRAAVPLERRDVTLKM
jgi:lysozyme family protein